MTTDTIRSMIPPLICIRKDVRLGSVSADSGDVCHVIHTIRDNIFGVKCEEIL